MKQSKQRGIHPGWRQSYDIALELDNGAVQRCLE